MKSLIIPVAVMFSTFLFTGCYTQFVMVDQKPPPEPTVDWVIDSTTGDTVKVIKQVDTIRTRDRETCIWERDLMGYPHLRCYNSYYNSDWFYYNNSPWWYRNDPYWYDYNRCPRYYYYDPSCGCCRYTSDRYYRNSRYDHYYEGSSGSGSTPPAASGSHYRSRARGIPDPKSAGSVKRSTSTTATTSKSSTSAGIGGSAQSGEVIIPPDNDQKKVIINNGGSPIPKAGTAAPAPREKKVSPSSRTGASSGNSSRSSSSSVSPAPRPSSSSSSSSQSDNQERRPRRRSRGSW